MTLTSDKAKSPGSALQGCLRHRSGNSSFSSRLQPPSLHGVKVRLQALEEKPRVVAQDDLVAVLRLLQLERPPLPRPLAVLRHRVLPGLAVDLNLDRLSWPVAKRNHEGVDVALPALRGGLPRHQQRDLHLLAGVGLPKPAHA